MQIHPGDAETRSPDKHGDQPAGHRPCHYHNNGCFFKSRAVLLSVRAVVLVSACTHVASTAGSSHPYIALLPCNPSTPLVRFTWLVAALLQQVARKAHHEAGLPLVGLAAAAVLPVAALWVVVVHEEQAEGAGEGAGVRGRLWGR